MNKTKYIRERMEDEGMTRAEAEAWYELDHPIKIWVNKKIVRMTLEEKEAYAEEAI